MPRDEPAARAGAISQTALIAIGYLLLSIVGIVGLSMGSVPFAVDLPNHAARLYVECDLSDPVLSRMYEISYDLIPNLAIDLINRPLCGLADPMTVIRVAMALSLAGVLAVTWKIHRLLNEWPNAFVLLAPAMSFNIVTGMGYLNYFIGTFLFLLFAWLVLRFRLHERMSLGAIVIGNFFGALLFLCHIFALALTGVFLFGMRFATGAGPLLKRGVKAGTTTAICFVVPLLMIVLADRSGSKLLYTIEGKVRAIWAPMMYSNVPLATGLLIAWVALFYWAWREKVITFAPVVRWALLFLLGFALLLPTQLLDAVDLDSRSFISISYLAIAAIGLQPTSSARLGTILASLIALATAASQLAFAVPRVLRFDRQIAEIRQAFGVIGPNQSVFTIIKVEAETSVPQHLYSHVASYATLDRRAYNPFEFTGRGMQPMSVKPEFACIDVGAGRPIQVKLAQQLLDPSLAPELETMRYKHLNYAYMWDRKFDYVIYLHFGAGGNPAPDRLRPVKTSSFFTLFRTPKPLGQKSCAG